MIGLLQGKSILVTGGASGIGRGSAKLFADMGARVFISDIDPAALGAARKELPVAGALAGDITVEVDCEAVVAAAADACGGLDGLFHCAGIADRVAPVDEIDVDTWQRIVDVTLRGTFLMARATGRRLRDGRGAIVTVSSVNGMGAFPRRHAYGPAKAAVALLTKSLACEWGDKGIRINALAPGYISTPMVAALAADGRIDLGRIEGRTPMRRFGRVEEVGQAAAFLLSDLASYITGTVLPVDGGWSAFGGAGEVATA